MQFLRKALKLGYMQPHVHQGASPELDALLQQAHEVAASLRMVAAQPLRHRAEGNRTPAAFGSRSLPGALQPSLPAGLPETAWHMIDAAADAFERVDSAPGPLVGSCVRYSTIQCSHLLKLLPRKSSQSNCHCSKRRRFHAFPYWVESGMMQAN